MHGILVSTETVLADAAFAPDAEAAHHLRDVLRARAGDAVRLTDGAGRAREAAVAALSRREVLVEPRGSVLEAPPPAPAVTLFQCVAKPARMDWLLEKAVELGAARVVPVLSARTVARLRPGETPDRWRRILDAALLQCGGFWRTELAPAVEWAGAMAAMRAFRDAGGALLAGSLAPGARPLGETVLALRARPEGPPAAWGWLVGPEGDFAPEELAEALAAGAAPVTLGRRVLRVETAALQGLAAIRAFGG